MTAKSLSPAAALWSELVDTAMLGTDRRPLPAPPAGPFGRFGLGSDAVALLHRAAAVLAARRAGAVPEPAGLPLTPCLPDDRVQCPGPAAARLGAMLAGRHADLLGEWLAALRAADLALPPEHLAVLVERTRDDHERFRMVSAAAGSLLSWLSALLPSLGWPTTSGEPPEEAWERGTAAERVAALRAMRAADPASVKSRLSGGLPGERVDVRAACYATLAVGLSPADEGLLERALDDRGSAVREVAAGLLATLPTSAWAGRMAQRARRMVRTVGPAGQDQFEIALVAPLPPTWERDGINASAPPGTSLGVHLLRQVVAGTPLAVWEDMSDVAHLLVLASEHELGPVLIAGWTEAAARQRDGRWGRLLAEETADPVLVPVLAADDVRRLALRSAVAGEVLAPMALAAFEAMPAPWSPELRSKVGEAVATLFLERRVGRHRVPSLRRLARALDPAMLVAVSDTLTPIGLPAPVDGLRDELVDLLRFRGAMLEELVPWP
ncbi:MAG TPA: DUF5691 domain-containing protein [Actinomycetota bacterium]|nr:DUF5691 domain-containing protein [Actinomycetota bacterium]